MTHPTPRRRRLLVAGFVTSLVIQVVLIVVGVAYLITVEAAASAALLIVWAVLGTAYVIGIVVVLTVAARSAESDEPPMLVELTILPRLVSLVAAILVSSVGAAATVQHIFLDPQTEFDLFVDVVGIWTMILAWALLHWNFAQMYLQHYYREGGTPMRFPGGRAPGILEFAYFAFTIAVSLAASDVEVRDRRMRGRVLAHAVVAFFFNGLIVVTAFGAFGALAQIGD